MSKITRASFPRVQRRAEDLGERLRLARSRRGITATDMAARVGASRDTLHRLEKGDLTIGLSVLARYLGVLGLEGDLDMIARDDELGRRLQDIALSQPARGPRRRPPTRPPT
ncbi:MAG: helix-turn-helix domain-containing protein [Candidatus Limnocylindrales bacterium]